MSLAQHDEKWMLAVSSQSSAACDLNASSVSTLQDPATKEPRQYIVTAGSSNSKSACKSIVELRSLPSDYSSFIVGSHIVKDGNLYVLNRVDPLFFVLGQLLDPSSTEKIPWQPLDQCLAGLSEELRSCVEEGQLGHICETLCSEQTDNVTYFKLSVSKTLVWLRRKQERVFQCFLTQEKQRRSLQQRREEQAKKLGGSSSISRGGSTSSTFHMPEDSVSAAVPTSSQSSTSDSDVISSKEADKFKMESIQVVSSYLSETWTEKLLESHEVTRDRVFGTTKKTDKASTTTTMSHSTTSTTNISEPTPTTVTPKPIKKLVPSRSMGNKQLEKVNKRGMSSLTSFFGPSKKKGKK